jgi:hypothetical protein
MKTYVIEADVVVTCVTRERRIYELTEAQVAERLANLSFNQRTLNITEPELEDLVKNEGVISSYAVVGKKKEVVEELLFALACQTSLDDVPYTIKETELLERGEGFKGNERVYLR